MSYTVPFKRYIITRLLLSDNIPNIRTELKKKSLNLSENGIEELFGALLNTAYGTVKEALEERHRLDMDNENHTDFLKHLGVYEAYDHYNRGMVLFEEHPDHIKHMLDCEWILRYEDVMTLVNMFLFNEEPHESIAAILKFKYRKSMPTKSIDLYEKMFCDTKDSTAKEVMQCMPFLKNSSVIIRKLHNGEKEIEHSMQSNPERHNGMSVDSAILDTEYMKWKIGYKDIKAPSTKDFLEKVQKDAMYKYYEAMNLTNSVDTATEEGTGIDGGEINITRRTLKNIEEAKAKMSQQWLNMYIKATDKMPSVDADADDFFDRMEQLNLQFEEYQEEKIASIEDVECMLDDVKGDIR